MSLHAVAPEDVPGQDGFFQAAPESKWYANLKRFGSCIRLLELLKEDPTLIHELGREDMTVLHKGVQHGCVALVRFILVDMFDDHGHCKCSRHGADAPLPGLTREQLLRKTCSYGSTAVNMAVVSGSPKMVVLLEWAIDMCERLSEQSTKENSSEDFDELWEYRNAKAIRSRCMAKMGREEEVQMERFVFADNVLLVPEVRDDDLSMLYPGSSEVKSKVISVIDGVLGDPGDEHRQWMDMVKETVVQDVDFEFVPLAHVFLHFLYSIGTSYDEEDGFNAFRENVTKRIFEACGGDGEDGECRPRLTTLFNILDPRGRTFLHTAFESREFRFLCIFWNPLHNISRSIKAECLNSRDGAGRSIFHLMAIHDQDPRWCIVEFKLVQSDVGVLALKERLSSPQDQKLNNLKRWCFPHAFDLDRYRLTALDFAILVNARIFICPFLPSDGSVGVSASIDEERHWITKYSDNPITSIQLAALLGRAGIIEHLLKHHTKYNSVKDPGLGNEGPFSLPAIHCAAIHGQVEAIQSILKFPIYDPMVQHFFCGTALHLLLDKRQSKENLNDYHNTLLCHVLPNSQVYKNVKDDVSKLICEDVTPKMYSLNVMSCINLLLQAGIDIWTPHFRTKELPSPGVVANDEARKWWYDKVVSEVVVLKTNVSYAANATSVVAALVATASFMGPFQPPLGYGEIDGFVRTGRNSLRVYLVCNTLSFYFSIASILMLVLPAIPMPKESLYDELLRSRRCMKGAAMMLLVSIICLLISFSSASMAVVSPKWHERGIVVGCVIFGGMICVVVLMIYIIRLLRMLFHRNDRFRRMFARHMYF